MYNHSQKKTKQMKKITALLLLLTLTVATTFAQKPNNHRYHRQSKHNSYKYGVFCHNYLSVIG